MQQIQKGNYDLFHISNMGNNRHALWMPRQLKNGEKWSVHYISHIRRASFSQAQPVFPPSALMASSIRLFQHKATQIAAFNHISFKQSENDLV